MHIHLDHLKSAGKFLLVPAVFSLFLCAGAGNAYADDTAASAEESTDDSGTDFIYRLYDGKNQIHFYTADYEERDRLALAGWTYEGISWTAPASSDTPVYRFYDSASGEHLLTVDEEERADLAAAGWIDEGVCFYSDDNQEIPVYRANRNGFHVYTASTDEYADLAAAGWSQEGIAWYAMNSSAEDPHPITIYDGVDYSAIYDFWYFRDNNPDAVNQVGYSDGALIQYFVEHGMDAGLAGKADFDQTVYDTLHQQFVAKRNPMLAKALSYDSPTGYLIMTDQSTYTTAVFTGSKGNWQLVQEFPCAVGAGGRTPNGVYHVGMKELYFGTNSYRCWYASQISGNYLYHSTLYYPSGAPTTPIDSRTGMAISHGCIRLPLDDAKWIYDNVPQGTTIVIYSS